MWAGGTEGRSAVVLFTGSRPRFFWALLRGYLLLLPTVGVYRFWLTTWKRRFYWSNTELDGDPLEYTGSALQLLIGFLLALTIFLPLYGVFFYLSTQNSTTALLGYAGVGLLLWFLSGYAIYRARDFRLSRTLWRGIRFDQAGSAWGYAVRRFGWSILMVLTLGLVYPLMAGNLWRYRYNNTWYGDLQLSMSGGARTVAGPFYMVYALVAGLVLALMAYAVSAHAFSDNGRGLALHPEVILLAIPIPLILWAGVYWYQAREVSRMVSTVSAGAARLLLRLRARDLIGQFVIYSLVLSGAMVALGTVAAVLVGVLIAVIAAQSPAGTIEDLSHVLAGGGVSVMVTVVFGYLVVLGTFTLLGEVILGFGYWLLVARGLLVTDIDSLGTVRARGEDPALVGEGLADALNVGAY